MIFTKALVTGASSGIGEALAHLFADQGIPLIIVGRNVERLEAAAAALKKKVSVTTVAADLSSSEGRSKLITVIHREVPDLVINNAGIGLYGEILSYPLDKQREILETNATAVFELTVEAARALVTIGKKGVIMNISSVSAYQPFPYFTTYAATKAFVKSFSEALDYEVAPRGVRVLTSCPGVILTRFQELASDQMNFKQRRLHTIPLDTVVKDIWHQIQKGKAMRLFDWQYRLLTLISTYLIPKRWLFGILNHFFIGKLPHRDLVPAPQPTTKSSS